MTSIGEKAFYGCSNLSTVTIENSEATIGEDAFYGCIWHPLVYDLPGKDCTIIKEADFVCLYFNNVLKTWTTHEGTDFTIGGEGTVCAIADGTVLSVDNSTMNGYSVTIEHENGYVSIYRCLGDTPLVTADEVVTQGQAIGVIGTSLYSESDVAAHLHLEITKDGTKIDPMTILPSID